MRKNNICLNSPTIPKRTQYIAAKIGSGIDAKKAPNFPVDEDLIRCLGNMKKGITKPSRLLRDIPIMEKNII